MEFRCMLQAGYLLAFSFGPEDGGEMFFTNVG
jgi:hypothetical protein